MVMLPPKPRVIKNDVISFFARRERHNWIALVFAMAMPCLFIWLFVLDLDTNILPDEPVVIYAENWSRDRTDEDIIERQRELALSANERNALRRERFQAIAEEMGIDYDRDAAAEAERITDENRERLGGADEEAGADGATADAAR